MHIVNDKFNVNCVDGSYSLYIKDISKIVINIRSEEGKRTIAVNIKLTDELYASIIYNKFNDELECAYIQHADSIVKIKVRKIKITPQAWDQLQEIATLMI